MIKTWCWWCAERHAADTGRHTTSEGACDDRGGTMAASIGLAHRRAGKCDGWAVRRIPPFSRHTKYTHTHTHTQTYLEENNYPGVNLNVFVTPTHTHTRTYSLHPGADTADTS